MPNDVTTTLNHHLRNLILVYKAELQFMYALMMFTEQEQVHLAWKKQQSESFHSHMAP